MKKVMEKPAPEARLGSNDPTKRPRHYVELDAGVVARYAILAPTQWNFHPRGPAACALATLAARDRASLGAQARLLVLAIDPCVEHRVTLH